MTRSRLNGAGDVRGLLRAVGFGPAAATGGGEGVYWGPCATCGSNTTMVDLANPSPAAACRNCGTRQPLLELLEQRDPQRPKHQLSDWLPTMADLESEAQDDPEADWLLAGLLPADGVSLLVAPPKAGKSTLARTLGAAITAGRPEWLGRPLTAGEGVVIHLALEERPRTVRGHYARLEADPERLRLLRGLPPSRVADRVRKLQDAVREVRPALVVIDTLQRWARISDGNAYSEVTESLTPLIHLARECSTHVMLVHHSRKNGGKHGEEVLGSTAFAGSVDTILSVKREDDTRTIRAEGRDGVEMEPTVLTMDADGWVRASGTPAEASWAELEGRILEWLREWGQEASRDDILRGVGGDRTQAVAALNRLVEAGTIVRMGDGKRGSPYTYSVLADIGVNTES